MSKWDACVVSAQSTAATLVVTTKDALLCGATIMAGATATAGGIVVHVTNTTGAAAYALTHATSGDRVSGGPSVPVVCSGGMVVTCTGTAFNFTVAYIEL